MSTDTSPEAVATAEAVFDKHLYNHVHEVKDSIAEIIDKGFAEKLQDLKLQIDSNRRALGQEICEGLKLRGYWTPDDTASSDVINAVFQAFERERNKLKKVCDDHIKVAAKYEKLGNTRAAMEIRKTANLLGAMYQGHKVTTTYGDPDG